MILWLMLACGDQDGPSDASCEDQAGLERDMCLHQRLMTYEPTAVDAVVADLRAIDDPVVRKAAGMDFVRAHRDRIPLDRAHEVCQTLDAVDIGQCVNKVTAAHMNRAPSQAAAGLDEAAVATVVAALPQCETYAGDERALVGCAQSGVRDLSVEAMGPVCGALSGEDETFCRLGWVEPRFQAPDADRATLLRACGEVEVCRFQVIDNLPKADPVQQMWDCQRFAGHGFMVDCCGHAAQRWMLSGPDPDEIARVNAARTPFPDRMGFYVGAAMVCGGHEELGCDVALEGETPHPDHATHCELGRTRAASDPGICQLASRGGPGQGGGGPGRGPGDTPPRPAPQGH